MEGSIMMTLLIIAGIAVGGSALFGFNIIPDFDFLGIQFNWITALIIILFFGVLIWGAIKSSKIFLVLCVIGVLAMSSIATMSYLEYRDMKERTSATRGDIEQRIPFEDMDIHNFDVDTSSLVFMPAGVNDSQGKPIYFVQVQFPRFDFDDTKKEWMLINNRPVYDMYNADREIEAVHVLLFSDGLNNPSVTQVNLFFLLTFYQTHTRLQISFSETGDCLNLLSYYFMLNGLNIRIIEVA
jgi:hypothetical protein